MVLLSVAIVIIIIIINNNSRNKDITTYDMYYHCVQYLLQSLCDQHSPCRIYEDIRIHLSDNTGHYRSSTVTRKSTKTFTGIIQSRTTTAAAL